MGVFYTLTIFTIILKLSISFFQIGHLKSSDERTIVSPKFVTSLTDKRIRDVSTSDAAIVVMLESGDVIALNDFATRRIMSTKQFDVVKMVATGGHLDSRVAPNTDLVSCSYFYRLHSKSRLT